MSFCTHCSWLQRAASLSKTQTGICLLMWMQIFRKQLDAMPTFVKQQYQGLCAPTYPMTFTGMGFWQGLQCKAWIPSCGAALKSNQRVVGCPHNSHRWAHFAYMIAVEIFRVHSWPLLLMPFLHQQLASSRIWGLASRSRIPRSLSVYLASKICGAMLGTGNFC